MIHYIIEAYSIYITLFFIGMTGLLLTSATALCVLGSAWLVKDMEKYDQAGAKSDNKPDIESYNNNNELPVKKEGA